MLIFMEENNRLRSRRKPLDDLLWSLELVNANFSEKLSTRLLKMNKAISNCYTFTNKRHSMISIT